MKLTQKAIAALSIRSVRLALALGLGFTELWINKVVEANKVNGPLTLEASLRIITQETGLTREEILEEEKVMVAVK